MSEFNNGGVMVDGSHLLSRSATGIGSYAHSLCSAISQLGLNLEVLYGENVYMQGGKDPESIAMQTFGSSNTKYRKNLSQKLRGLITKALRLPGGATPFPVSAKDIDFSGLEYSPPRCGQSWNASNLFDQARSYFIRGKRMFPVKRPSTADAMHWTFPWPVAMPGIPNIYTIHDMIPIRYPYFVEDSHGFSLAVHKKIARTADLILTVSEASKRDILDILRVPEERVAVTYQPTFKLNRLSDAVARKLVASCFFLEPGQYALFISAISPRKNVSRIIQSYLGSGIRHPLVLVGPLGWMHDADMRLIDSLAQQYKARKIVPPPVQYIGQTSRTVLTALLQCARFLASPTIGEGFGLPALEAMRLGVPVLASTSGSLPEITGDAAVFADPFDCEAMSRAFSDLANDDSLCADLAAKGYVQAEKFSEQNYQRKLEQAYAKVGIAIPKAKTAPKE